MQHAADALKRLLAGVQYPPAAVADKVRGVYDELLRQSPRIRSGLFTQFGDPDLALLFDLYDERFFAGGLQSAPHAKSLRKQPGGKVVITDGPYLETKEHIGGFWILDAANMDEAVAWGRKAVVACRASVEVREFLAMPTE